MTARVAVQYQKGLIKRNQTRTFSNGLTQSQFTGQVIAYAQCGLYNAVIVEVSGNANYTGSCRFTLEEGDHLGKGFLLD